MVVSHVLELSRLNQRFTLWSKGASWMTESSLFPLITPIYNLCNQTRRWNHFFSSYLFFNPLFVRITISDEWSRLLETRLNLKTWLDVNWRCQGVKILTSQLYYKEDERVQTRANEGYQQMRADERVKACIVTALKWSKLNSITLIRCYIFKLL